MRFFIVILFAVCISAYCEGEYPCYHDRIERNFEGLWDFTLLPKKTDPTKINISSVVYTDMLYVPGAYDATTRYAGLRGSGVYRRTFHQTPNTESRILFESCAMWCNIFVDGKSLKIHNNAYTAFWVDVPSSSKSIREIVVIADNQFDTTRYPIGYYGQDFWQYGGIYRKVSLYEVPSLSIKNADVMVNDYKKGLLNLRVRIHSTIGNNIYPPELLFNVIFDEDENNKIEVKGNYLYGVYMLYNLTVPNPTLWSPSNPNLHLVRVNLLDSTKKNGIILDSFEDRFGLRLVSACGKSICINEEPIQLRGWCRHDLEFNYGPHMPKIQMYQDIKQLQELNGNYFRLVHYPHDPRFLSLCDEMGILIWQETYGWGNGENQVLTKPFQEAQLYELEEMVNHTINHPSVILWAYLNEGCSDSQKCCDQMYKPLAQRYRELEVPGLITYASNRVENDKCLDSVDVISFNTYPGWFEGGADLQENLDSIKPYVRNEEVFAHSKFPNKPFLKSEIGAESVWGWDDRWNGLWTQEYQQKYINEVLDVVVGNSSFAGISLWQFFDTRTYNAINALQRPRAINNMGSLDEYRRPKPVTKLIKEYYGKK